MNKEEQKYLFDKIFSMLMKDLPNFNMTPPFSNFYLEDIAVLKEKLIKYTDEE